MKLLNILISLFCTCLADINNELIPDRNLPLCDDLLKKASRNRVQSPLPLLTEDIAGTWVSQSCETRPGPEYVVRVYKFDEEGRFKSTLHKYSDDTCQEPLYSLSVKGKVKLTDKSMVTPGGTEAGYLLSSIKITPHSDFGRIEANKFLENTGFCKIADHNFTQHQPTVLFDNYENNLHPICHKPLNWNELQLMRLEIKKSKTCRKKTLFMGDLHTILDRQAEYRPTAYQIPLLNKNCFGCKQCKTILASSAFQPPILDSNDFLMDLDVDGHWSSYQCEVQRHGMFLTRYLHFTTETNTWSLEQLYYADNQCKIPVYKIYASGEMYIHSNKVLPQEIDFNISSISVAPEDEIFAEQLNNLPKGTCGNGIWQKGKQKELVETGGCPAMGILAPVYQLEIIKQTQRRKHGPSLHLGQTPTWRRRYGSPSLRPTSWSPPLKKCRKMSLPIETNVINHITGPKAALTSSGVILSSAFVNIMLTTLAGLNR